MPPPPLSADYEIRVVGARRTPLRDLYHAILRWRWSMVLVFVSVVYLATNALFALGYLALGGVAGAGRASYADAFFFSVQTMGTIGYGALHPVTPGANVLVVAESLTGLIYTALATGIVFARFSRMRARVLFARKAVVTPLDGVPTLMIRVGNERGNLIVDAHIRMAISLTETTAEGVTMYRNYPLRPVRDRLLSLSRSWTVLHAIDDTSPLHGRDHDALVAQEAELFVAILGLDDATMQPIHAQTRYFPDDIVWGARYADILTEMPDGNMLLDLRRFHEIERPG